MNNKNRSLYIIILFSITSTIAMSQRSGPHFISADSNNNAMSNNSIFIHGGGSGKVTCADDSHPQANVAFVMLSVNGTVKGNWTLDDFNEHIDQGTFFTEGKIYNGNATLNRYAVIGNSDSTEEEIKLCNTHLQTPISINGPCGQNVAITVKLVSNKMIKNADTFNGDVTCSSQ